jgi:hypothetical protein
MCVQKSLTRHKTVSLQRQRIDQILENRITGLVLEARRNIVQIHRVVLQVCDDLVKVWFHRAVMAEIVARLLAVGLCAAVAYLF